MQFQFPKTSWSPEIFDRLLKAVGDAVFKFDFDSNNQAGGLWLGSPAGGAVEHGLGVLPKQVIVYEADDAEGTGMVPATWTAVTTTTITISVSKSFCRVLLNK